jgi:hypothetical protein
MGHLPHRPLRALHGRQRAHRDPHARHRLLKSSRWTSQQGLGNIRPHPGNIRHH